MVAPVFQSIVFELRILPREREIADPLVMIVGAAAWVPLQYEKLGEVERAHSQTMPSRRY